jgi:hypothetical protein
MFPAAISQPAEMGREGLTHVFDRRCCRQKRRMRQYWAPIIGERQLNPTFIFNSALEA